MTFSLYIFAGETSQVSVSRSAWNQHQVTVINPTCVTSQAPSMVSWGICSALTHVLTSGAILTLTLRTCGETIEGSKISKTTFQTYESVHASPAALVKRQVQTPWALGGPCDSACPLAIYQHDCGCWSGAPFE